MAEAYNVGASGRLHPSCLTLLLSARVHSERCVTCTRQISRPRHLPSALAYCVGQDLKLAARHADVRLHRHIVVRVLHVMVVLRLFGDRHDGVSGCEYSTRSRLHRVAMMLQLDASCLICFMSVCWAFSFQGSSSSWQSSPQSEAADSTMCGGLRHQSSPGRA